MAISTSLHLVLFFLFFFFLFLHSSFVPPNPSIHPACLPAFGQLKISRSSSLPLSRVSSDFLFLSLFSSSLLPRHSSLQSAFFAHCIPFPERLKGFIRKKTPSFTIYRPLSDDKTRKDVAPLTCFRQVLLLNG